MTRFESKQQLLPIAKDQRIRQWSPSSSSLFSSPDADPEMINEEGGDDYVYATSEPFDAEADIAQAANELAATNPSIELHKEIEQSFLKYALSIILGRALPDARDGLKPVHRRILYAMHQLNLSPNMSHRKCARVVGEVLGKYHPHGDMSVYDALVRMAQDFTTHYRLIDGHGNFGSVDADPAAAMRYTECRLTRLSADALMTDLSENTVDMIENFDGNEQEPIVLPSRLPLLLLNGSSGIAVGMATNVPPHNLREILSACKALVGGRVDPSKEITDDQLMTLVPGPDFPTGASMLGTDGAKKLYTTGNGGVVMRAVTEVESVLRGKGQSSRTAIVVKELPYQVNKASLLEKTAALVNDKKLEGIADLRDESDRDGIRVVFELKRDAVPNIVLNNLYKKTQLQTSFSGNFLALFPSEDDEDALKPHRFTLREALDCFLDFRFKTIRRKTANQLEKVEKRAHIVDGLIIALEKVDEVIELIRSAPDQASAREALMDEEGIVKLSPAQADSVLKLQLGQLTRLNQGKLDAEKKDLQACRKELTRLIEEDDAVYEVMVEEFDEMDGKFGQDRKTVILNDDGAVNDIDMVKNSRSVIVVTQSGYIKRMPLKTFESQGRGTRGKRGTSGSASSVDDEVSHVITCNDHDTLLMIAQNGIAYGLRAYQVPTATRTAKGTPIPSVLPVSTEQRITTILPVSEFSKNEYIVLTTEQGWIKRTPLDAFEKISARGLTIASLGDGDKLKWCQPCTDDDDILIASSRGQATRFSVEKFRPTGRSSRGVRAMKLKDGDTIADMNVLSTSVSDDEKKEKYILCMTKQGYGKRTSTDEFRSTGRGVGGVIAIKFKPNLENIDKLSCFCIVREDDEILVNTAKGVMVRQKVANIGAQSRSATGVVVQKVDNGDEITSVSLVPKRA
eukprot:CAMPEP_0113652336 /NCGR_PEP_ID=MMETSP0017_2-20120614/27949_1 /TAXON_ID=2856 /ORGANISM="Cylindrotheca closterium" /LENGTH=908 /DNA_ID=CAMNT_0000565171 /DNA_START=81 /DNA_END=2803 /DNA_ORIENTATION=+ /assembly_acc=CAM_ASM_000147